MVNMHTSLNYAMLYYALKRAVSKLSFLAKPYWPNGHNNWMDLVDPPARYKLDTQLLMGIHGMGPTMGLSMTPTLATIIGFIAISLVAVTLILGPSI